MGIEIGAIQNIDGLIFSIDAANFRSYSGSGLTSFGLVGGIGGTLVNGVGFTSANGGSFVFDKTNDYIIIPDNSSLNSFTNMTLEIVVKYTTTSDQIFAQKWNYSGGSQGYTIELYLNEIAAACYTGVNYLRVSVSNYPANNIYHIILTLSGTTQTLYINGVSVASNSGGSIPNISGTSFTIGNRSNLSGTYLGGNVYSTKFYNRALTAQEILQNYNATKGRYGL
jgi:hypothetical protein